SPAAEPRSAASTFTFESRDGALAISSGGQRVADYVYRDEKIPRPYFAHLCAPGGIQVTRNHPPQPGKDPTDHDALHPGLWLAFGDISGHDFWRNKASIRHERFTEPPAVRDGRLTFATESRLRTTNQQTLGTQVSRIALTVRPEGYLLVWEATFEAIEQDLFFGNQEEMGLGVRVATPITEKNGGLITGSTGTKTAKGTWGKAFDWCDYSGVIGDRRVGVTLMPDPANFRPSWFHNRDYGLMVANPFGRKAMGQGDLSRVEVKKGERLRLRFGVLMHSNTPEKHVDLAAAYRDVLEQSALFAVQPAEAAPELPDIFSYRAQDLAALRQGFVQPPREAGPWVYWFWWKSVVSRGEIARELEELAAAGIAGAELRVVTFHGWGGKPLAGMDPANLERLGHRKFAYLSDEWLDVMEFTCSEAQRLGLRLAINLGQGWPPGGPWIGDAHRTKHLSWKSQEVHGPGTFSPEDLPAEGMVLAWKLADTGRSKTVATNSFLDLTSLISRQGSRRALTWEVPAGRWLVGVFSVTPGGICDKGEGPEVDPASREAVLFHLDHMFSRLDPKLRRFYGTTLVDVASDSWEYERNRDGGRYFSPAILDAFPKGAGYDFRERMHALLDYGPDAERVRHDLEAVERHLIHENYFATVARFLNERGLRHRPQIYGRGLSRDLLEAYTLADTPEIEQGICLPEGPWAAHAAGRPIVSAEAFTFLSDKLALVRRPHGPWETAPAALRWSANHFFGEGINRIQMHSFSYSPPGLPLPGWRMYAEVHLNRNVPWWPFMVPLNVWISRQQWLLQAGRPVADALVYPVKSDPEDGPFFSMGDRQPLSAANAIDAANERTLPLVPRAVGAGRYDVRTLVLLKAPTTAEEARQVLALIGAGARLLCCHSLPADWPALRTAGGEALREGFARLEASGMIADARAGGWKAALAQARSVCWSPAEANLVFQHRRLRDGDIYFLVNYGEAFRGEVSFPHLGERAEVWNADTGQTAPVGRYAEHHGRIHIPVALDHFASASFVFSRGPVAVHVTDAPGGEFHFDTGVGLMGRFDRSGDYSIQLSDGTTHEIAVALPPPLRIDGPWELSVSASQAVSPQAPLTLRLDRLVSWRE
ncbi:MAG: hypothetical protein FJW35_09920, partial [Acidobacteria bacterium]|nr:hypothetical protein [Acidobacteriota bacterium]